MRIAFLSRVLPALGSRHSAARAVTALVALCSSATLAAAASNVHTFSCAQGFTGTLCKAGAGSNCMGGNNPNDVLKITGTTAASVITFSFTNTGTTSIDTKITGQANTADPSPNTVTVSPGRRPAARPALATQTDSPIITLTSPPVLAKTKLAPPAIQFRARIRRRRT